MRNIPRAPRTANAPTAAPMPIPAFAPVERPGLGDGVDVSDDEFNVGEVFVGVPLDDEESVVEVVEESLCEGDVMVEVTIEVKGASEVVSLIVTVLVPVLVLGIVRSSAELLVEELVVDVEESVLDAEAVKLPTAVGEVRLEMEAVIEPALISKKTASLRLQQYLLAFRFSSQHQDPSEQS